MLTTDEVAADLHCKPETVTRWLCRGEIPAIKVGRRWLIDEDAFRTWKKSHANVQVSSRRRRRRPPP